MTVDAQPIAKLSDLSDLGFAVVEHSELPAELLDLVDQVRGLVHAVARTQADTAVLAGAARTVAALTEQLGADPRPLGTMVHRTWPDGHTEYGTLSNIVAGPANPLAPPLELVRDGEEVRAEVTLNGLYEGPPGLVHGGWVAALLDQALGSASSMTGRPSLTANLDVNYRKPTPIGAELTVAARITGTERRKVFVSAEIRHHGVVTAEGTAVMVQVAVSRS
ncbi:PaaI family thioesterase [Nocardiopsis ansamitocini]|uniref:Acyl-coenzyme A thioesterase THEM4 n=1 Tax=Nocardiopsis ansamitocini TaxID=1670832 RepID=A0A9W6P2J4_9ACTN|nr:PaaI family thioesterase [Nocardiopsis ansamitocini]GLU45954.1 aromatic compound degradation protein PaaI [Nocardiopsis ansamitocini]